MLEDIGTARTTEKNRIRASYAANSSQADKILLTQMRVIIVAIGVARAAAFVPAPPEVAALRLKETLDERGFVRVPGATSSAV